MKNLVWLDYLGINSLIVLFIFCALVFGIGVVMIFVSLFDGRK